MKVSTTTKNTFLKRYKRRFTKNLNIAKVSAKKYKNLSVHKFGGSSIGSPEAIKNVCALMKPLEDSRNVIVVSAMYGVTDTLVEAFNHSVEKNFWEVQRIRTELLELHLNTAKTITGNIKNDLTFSIFVQIDSLISQTFESLLVDLTEGKDQKELYDSFVTLGEKLTSLLCVLCFHLSGETAVVVDPKDIIKVDGEYGNSIPDLSKTHSSVVETLEPLLQNHNIVVVPGFYGSDGNNEKTLGRGGSDLTATVLGHALNADTINLWKVECEKENRRMTKWKKGCIGVVNALTGPYSKTVPSLDYETATEMFKLGKKVIHPRAVQPAADKSIPILIANTYEPHIKGTIIQKASSKSRALVVNPYTHISNHEEIKLEFQSNIKQESFNTGYVVSVVGDIEEKDTADYENLLNKENIPFVRPSKVLGLKKTLAFVISADKLERAKAIILKKISLINN